MIRYALGLAAVLISVSAAQAVPPAWSGYAGNAQHTGKAPARSQTIGHIHWQTPVDLAPPAGGELLIHYASPMITAAGTLLLPVKTSSSGAFKLDAMNGATGADIWSVSSNYVLPSSSWLPSFPAHLTAQNRLYYAMQGGVVGYRDTPDSATGPAGTIAFFGNALYAANPASFNATVTINTPITSDNAGNIYFGFLVSGSNPANLSGGIARISAAGVGTWVSAATAAKDSSVLGATMNGAPAVSRDGALVYVPVTSGSTGYLVALNGPTLTAKAKVLLLDPSNSYTAWLVDESSAAPTIGPDGDVFFGVLENGNVNHHYRGWLLHFSEALKQTKLPGSFGWDDTVSIVPSRIVASYHGTSSYLLFTKYNDYIEAGGTGQNKVAVIDPNTSMDDPIIPSVPVMKEVLTLVGPTPYPGVPGAVYEWCINSGVVDAGSKSIIANSEDGTMYRFDLTSGAASQKLALNAPRAEAYTPTVIGPDGTIYVINNATLYAIGR